MTGLQVYHYPLCPFSRKLRLTLKEKKLDFDLIEEKFWHRRREYLQLNPAGDTPILVFEEKRVVSGQHAIFEFVEESYPEPTLLGRGPIERAKVRSTSEWFVNKLYNEVTKYILEEKLIKTIEKVGTPNSAALRAAYKNITYHLDYISYLLKNNTYLCGDKVTLADFSAAAQLSVLDYMNAVPWDRSENAKQWYALIKSRPSFKPLLEERINSIAPPAHYADPDF